MTCQQSAPEIIEHRLRSYSKLSRCALNREATVGPAHRILVHAVDFDGGNAPAGTHEPHLTSGPLLIKNDFADDKSQNALAIGCRRGGRVPNPRQVLAERL